MNHQLAVLLPHYNNPKGLKLTLQSLLNETESFTVFVFDDGSNDIEYIKEIVNGFSGSLDIELNISPVNLGITKALNRGLKHILDLNTFEFIARLDAGDVCLNNRFFQQKNILLKDTSIGLVASWVKYVDINRKELFVFKPPLVHQKLNKVIHLYNPFVHPAVMYRTDVVKKVGFYPENFPALEDHAYFFKILKQYKAAVLESVLLEYEVNPQGISVSNRKRQTKSRIKLFLHEYNFGFYATLGLLRAFITYLLPFSLLVFLKRKLF